MMEGAFIELSLIVAVATAIAAIARLLKQPLIIAYIIAGVLASPYLLGILESAETVSYFAQIGVVLLLFIVGLQLNPKTLKKLAGVSFLAGLGQVVITGVLGYLLAGLFGISGISALYIAVAITFSSTIIIVKLLSDKNELGSLPGRLSVGLLLVQDVIVAFLLLFTSSLGQGLAWPELALGVVLKAIILFIPLILFSFYILPKIVKFAARSKEFIFIFSIGWAFLVSALFYYFNFSIEIGALVAGITLSVSPYKDEIDFKIRPVRDFFVILFFIWLGSQIVVTDIFEMMWAVVGLSLFIIIIEPLIVMVLLTRMGFTLRTSFKTGLTMAQVSEFSLILISLGVKQGQIPEEMFSLIAFVGLFTIAVSSYLIMYSDKLYPYFSSLLGFLEKEKIEKEKVNLKEKPAEVILFGFNRIGHSLMPAVKSISRDFLIIDHDPDAIDEAEDKNYPHCYGDGSDPELIEDLNFSQTKLVISTIPDFRINTFLLNRMKEKEKKKNLDIIKVVTAYQIEEARRLYDKGADYVLLPHFLGGEYGSQILKIFGLDKKRYQKKKEDHLKQLKQKEELGHEHPLPEDKR